MRLVARLAEIMRSLCEPNPVFRRELRARWRRPAAFLTLFFYAAPLALGMALTYADKAPASFEEQPVFSTISGGLPIGGFRPSAAVSIVSVGDQMAVIGRDLFFGLALLQVVAWFLIAPTTASGAIAGERERGLLEALQMANLPARRVVLGKWLSILSFMALLFLVPLPVTAICFFFGGFTPQDFARVSLTIALTAIFGSILGLYFSSRRHRPAAALRDTLLFLVIWTGIAAFSNSKPQFFETLPLMLKRACAIVELAHPAMAMNNFDGAEFQWPARETSDDEAQSPYWRYPPARLGAGTGRRPVLVAPVWVPPYTEIDRESQWALNLAALATLSLLFFALAVRGTKKLLPDPTFVRRDWVARWKERLERRNAGQQSAIGRKARQALFAEMPLLSGRSFDNPVFGRELRGKTRLRAGAWWLWLLRAALVVVPLLFYIQTLADVMEGLHREEAWKRFSYLGLALLTLYASVSGAGAFTREREGGTWEGLKMTLLEPGQILHGKIWPLVIGIVALSLPLWPAFWLCLGKAEIISFRGYQNEITFTLWHFVVILGILLSTAFAAGCAALFISWLSRRTPLAVGLSLIVGAFFALVMTVPFRDTFISPVVALDGLVKAEPFRSVVPLPPPGYYERQRAYWHKEHIEKEKRSSRELQAAYDAQYLDAMENYRGAQRGILLCPLTMLTTGTILLLILSALMRQKFRDEK